MQVACRPTAACRHRHRASARVLDGMVLYLIKVSAISSMRDRFRPEVGFVCCIQV